MFLSVIDIHVQNAPISGRVISVTHTPGKFINAMEADSALYNENVLIGLDSDRNAGRKDRRAPDRRACWRGALCPLSTRATKSGAGKRISLIQFGSRCDLYLPLDYKIKVKVGDKVVGGETVMAAKS